MAIALANASPEGCRQDIVNAAMNAETLVELGQSEVACRWVLEHLHETAIVFTHAVTSTAATLWMAPLLCMSTVAELLAHAWQTGAALLSAYGEAPVDALDFTPETDADILAQAIAHGDDHVIKLSGACIGLRARTGDPLFAALPRRARELLPADT